MSHVFRVVVLLKAALAALFVILVFMQVVSLPGQFAHLAEENPENAELRWPLTAITIFWVLCAQVVIVAIWKLLGMVSADRIFSDSSMRWVDLIVWTLGAAWVVLAGVFLAVGFTADDPGGPILLALLTTAGAVFGLLMLVMRALLRQAIELRSDMDVVI